jgi:hypothetical protein
MRTATIAAGIALLVPLAGCGGSEPGPSAGTSGSPRASTVRPSGTTATSGEPATTTDSQTPDRPDHSAPASPIRARQRHVITRVVRRFYTALADRDGRRVCATLTSAARHDVGEGCSRQMNGLVQVNRSPAIQYIGRDGTTTVVTVRFAKGSTGRVALARSKGTWEIQEFSLPG